MLLEEFANHVISLKIHEDYYEFTIYEPGKEAVDKWVETIGLIWQKHLITNTRANILTLSSEKRDIPMSYAFKKGSALRKTFVTLPDTKQVFVVHNAFLTNILDSFLRLIRSKSQYKYVKPSEIDEAIAWLKA